MSILILGQSIDPHVSAVAKKLKRLGEDVVIFERFKRNFAIDLHYKKNKHVPTLYIKNKEYLLSSKKFTGVWWRVKPVLRGEIPGEIYSREEAFRIQEWREVLPCIASFLKEATWVNVLHKHHEMSKKINQLNLAMQCDLDIPHSVVTNHQKSVLKLFEYGRVIYKPLAPFFGKKKVLLTNEISYSMVKKNHKSIGLAPGIFQTLIEKSYELRVTVVGSKIFTAKIDSQQKQESTIDWRRKQTLDMFSEGKLSRATSIKLLKFHKKSGLTYAAYDFIVDKKGREIFLECNPGGQWLWLDDKLNLGITDALALALLD